MWPAPFATLQPPFYVIIPTLSFKVWICYHQGPGYEFYIFYLLSLQENIIGEEGCVRGFNAMDLAGPLIPENVNLGFETCFSLLLKLWKQWQWWDNGPGCYCRRLKSSDLIAIRFVELVMESEHCSNGLCYQIPSKCTRVYNHAEYKWKKCKAVDLWL